MTVDHNWQLGSLWVQLRDALPSLSLCAACFPAINLQRCSCFTKEKLHQSISMLVNSLRESDLQASSDGHVLFRAGHRRSRSSSFDVIATY